MNLASCQVLFLSYVILLAFVLFLSLVGGNLYLKSFSRFDIIYIELEERMKVRELFKALIDAPLDAEIVVCDCRTAMLEEVFSAEVITFSAKNFDEVRGLIFEGDTIVELTIG